MRFRDINASVTVFVAENAEEADCWNGYRQLVEVTDALGVGDVLSGLLNLYVMPPPGPGSTAVIWEASALVYDSCDRLRF